MTDRLLICLDSKMELTTMKENAILTWFSVVRNGYFGQKRYNPFLRKARIVFLASARLASFRLYIF
jgi:hypothetical protein